MKPQYLEMLSVCSAAVLLLCNPAAEIMIGLVHVVHPCFPRRQPGYWQHMKLWK